MVVIAFLVIIGGGLAGLAALNNRSSRSGGSSSDDSGGGTDAIKSDAYFYGDSPAVYPSRKLSRAMLRSDIHTLSHSEMRRIVPDNTYSQYYRSWVLDRFTFTGTGHGF